MGDTKLTAQQSAFLERYLGYEPPLEDHLETLREAVDAEDVNPADRWLEARAEVDVGLASLRAELASHDDPNLDRIAKFGLNGLSDGNQVALMGAFVAYSRATGADREKAAAQLRKRAEEFRAFLAADPLIALCEDNPFGVRVEIRAPLDRALRDIEAAIGR